jgi:biopolymer transport protein ExbD
MSSSVEEPIVNLTPLIDVVFVVLIAFILIAPLLHYEQVDLAQGAANLTSSAITQPSAIAISVRANNTVVINEQVIPLENLAMQLKQLKMQFPQTTPQLFHDQRATFGTYCQVKHALEQAGYHQLDIVLTPGS